MFLKLTVLEGLELNIVVDNLNTNYIQVGEGKPVLLLHGWGSSIEPFNRLINQLSEKYQVIALDLPGFGKTDEPPRPYNVDDYVDFVLHFLETFHFSSISIIGHSFGGRIIIKLANRELPFQIDKIVLIDSAGIKHSPNPKQSKKQKRYKRLKKLYSTPIMKLLFPNALEALRLKYGSADYIAASPMMRQCLVKAVNEDLSGLLPYIKEPTLLIWGENDVDTPLSDAKLMEQMIPDAGLAVIKNAAHFSFIDQPYTFHRIIASFFELG